MSEEPEDAEFPGRATTLERHHFAVSSGALTADGLFLNLCRFFDDCFRRLAIEHGAVEHRYPDFHHRAVLEQLGYLDAFPQLAVPMATANVSDDFVLTPAVCYHTYELFSGQEVQGRMVTAAGSCFRAESETSFMRLRSFTMREIVFFGSERAVERERRKWMTRVASFAEEVTTECDMEPASDPFFAAEGQGRGRQLIQRLRQLKFELRVSRPERAALASFNHHLDFFGRRRAMTLSNRSVAHSGCVAFGLERWVIAFLAANGDDPEEWPEPVMRFWRQAG